MRPVRPVGEAVVPTIVDRLWNEFEYPRDAVFPVPAQSAPGTGGMAHVLIVSTSEPQSVQDKADFVIPQSNSSVQLQLAFDSIAVQTGGQGAWSIWMAGVFTLDADVTAPSHAWIRGLGYTAAGCSS